MRKNRQKLEIEIVQHHNTNVFHNFMPAEKLNNNARAKEEPKNLMCSVPALNGNQILH